MESVARCRQGGRATVKAGAALRTRLAHQGCEILVVFLRVSNLALDSGILT
jgi:hypothetical protein